MTIHCESNKVGVVLIVGGAAATTIALAPAAAADLVYPTAGSESVGATVNDLKAQGFNVVVNYLEGQPNVPVYECQVIGIDNPSAPSADPSTVTVSVDVTCPNAK